MPTLILTQHANVPGIEHLEVYRAHGGYEALQAARQMPPEDLAEIVDASNLRGRGGAFFPTGKKWKSIAKDDRPRYVLANADESEPGTYKDHYLMMRLPHLLIEGMAIAGHGVHAKQGYVYLRGEALRVQRILRHAIAEARAAGILGEEFDIELHMGAGAYIAGEETGMIESVEGKRAWPRIRPHFHPSNCGLYCTPTLANNVETHCNLPWIVTHGAEAFRQVGSPNAPGTRLICTSGRLRNRDVFELPMGVTLREVIWGVGGGMAEGHEFKAAIPGGASTPMLPEALLDLPMEPDGYMKQELLLGAGSVTVLGHQDCVINMALRLNAFFRNESCGKCTPCRDGTDWLVRLLRRFETGGAVESDIDLLWDLSDNIIHKTLCALGWAATVPPQSTIRFFRDEYLAHIAAGKCPYGNVLAPDTFGWTDDLEHADHLPRYLEGSPKPELEYRIPPPGAPSWAL